MDVKSRRSCLHCKKSFFGKSVVRIRWRHEKSCFVKKLTPLLEGQTFDIASENKTVMANEAMSSAVNTSVEMQVENAGDVGVGFLKKEGLDVFGTFADIRSEAATIVRRAHALAALVSVDQFADRLQEQFPAWSRDMLMGIYDGC